MKCDNCKNEIVTQIIGINGNFCSLVCRNRNNCKRYYKRNHEQQKKRVLNNYYRFISTPSGHKRIRKINLKAHAKKRFGVSDRKEILSKFGYRCVFCLKKGTRKTLAIHHVDKNGRNVKIPNNKTDNLVSICPSCHSKIHFQNRVLKMMI